METDYAVRIVDALTRSGGRLTSEVIARQVCITYKFAHFIMHKLIAKGIVKAYRGPSGGYELTRPADEITLYDVTCAIEGPFVINRCTLEDTPCRRWPACECPYRNIFNRLTCYVQEQLSSVTFADVVKGNKGG
jgi:Rrf2 family protein